jgi:exodeoxyribonuclease VII small subunit
MSKKTFEQAIKRLEEIAGILESGSQSLEESIKLFEEGSLLVRFCEEKLAEAEKKVQILTKTDDGFQLNSTDLE